MIEMKNDLIESSSSNLVFLREDHFQRDLVAISPQKLTLNFESVLHCKYIDCTQYSFWLCYVCHCHLAVHKAADGCAQSMAVIISKYSRKKYSS